MNFPLTRQKRRVRRLDAFVIVTVCMVAGNLAFTFTQHNGRLLPGYEPIHASRLCAKCARISYADTFMDLTSLWAMGADARTIPPRRRHVPLVLWNDEAVSRVRAAWRQLQWSTSCERAMYIYPHSWGITSQMRDYTDAAFVALAFNRPLRVVRQAARPRWCEANAWLECFFKRLAGPTCARTRGELADVAPVRLQFSGNGSALSQAQHTLSGPGQLHLAYDAQFTFVLDDPKYFPKHLWDGMIKDGVVCFLDRHNRPIGPADLNGSPRLFHALSVSALRTILTAVIFRPREDIAHEARLRLQIKHIERPGSCVSVHLRWTDKRTDGGMAAAVAAEVVDHVPLALDRIRDRIGFRPRCLLVITDDDERATVLLKSKFEKKNLRIEMISSTSSLFRNGPLSLYNTYAAMGHSYFVQQAASPLQEERAAAFAYFRATIVDALAASHARIFIGMGSSGLSQLVSQYIGYSRRVDANALVIWQEDVMGV